MINLPVTHYFSRLTLLRESFKRKGIDGFLVTEIHNIRYLTGFTGSSALLLITKKENIFVTDFRYQEQAEKEILGWNIHIARRGMIKAAKNLSRKMGIKKPGFESSVSYEFFRRLSENLNLKACKGLIEKLREIKDADEINLIKEAVRRAETAFQEVRSYITQGIKEKAIACRLEEGLKKRAGSHIPLEAIVSLAANSASA